jgi:capsular polysaccharide biosynthesis protein
MRLLRKRFVKQGLRVECVPNGAIVVAEKNRCYGVFTGDGAFVKSSVQSRGKGQLIPEKNCLQDLPRLDADAVYLGNIDHTFGHYILEHWSRAYAFLREEYRAMKFVLVNDMRYQPIPQFVFELASLLGIPSQNLMIIRQSVQFRNVYVPECSFKLTSFSSKEIGALYAKIADNVPQVAPFHRIYVSRTALKQRKTYGEEKVQHVFEQNGYHIVYPEQHPLEEQIALMKNCRSLAGCAGTALHLALFMPPGGNVIQIRRNKLKDGNCGTQHLITEAKDIEIIYIDASIEKYKTRHYSEDKEQIIGINRHMKRFFDEQGFRYSASDVAFDREAWDEYIRASEACIAQFRRKHGGRSEWQVVVLRKLVKLMAGFILNRHRRTAFRTRVRKAWKLI